MIHTNSITSFEQLSFKAGLNQSEKVYHALEILGAQTDRELGVSTGIPYHLIPRCRKPLQTFDSITQLGSKIDPETGRTVAVWATTKSVEAAKSLRSAEAYRGAMARAPKIEQVVGGLFAALIIFVSPIKTHAKTVVITQTVRSVYAKVEVKAPKMAEKQAINKPKVTPLVSLAKTYQNHSNKDFYALILAHLREVSNQPDAFAEIIAKESGFNPYAINASSGACGLGQALPCEKMGCDLSDVDCQLRWMKSYIDRRYGSPEQALNFHLLNGWY